MFARGLSTFALAVAALGIAAALASPQRATADRLSAEMTGPKNAPGVSRASLDDISRAIADLNDTTLTGNWHNVAGYLGLLGLPECFPPLHDFIWGKFHGDIDDVTLAAIASAQADLGPVAASSPEALEYLIQGTNPYFWKALPWRDPRHPQAEVWLRMSEMSIYALGLCGKAEAGQMLARLRQSPYREAQRAGIEEAIREHQRVVRAGGSRRYVDFKWGPQVHWWRMAMREVPVARDSATASTPLAGLKLGLALDESVYAFGQPIMVMACLENAGSDRAEIPFLWTGQLDLRLVGGDGKRVSPIMRLLGGLPAEDRRRLTLGPDYVQCEVSDLLSRYGMWPGKKHPVAAAAGEYVLPPGRYRLVAVYRPELHRRPDGVVLTVPSDTVAFEISPLERFPEEVALLRDFATQERYKGGPAFGDSARSSARPWLGRFISSRFFMLAYQLGGWWGTVNIDSLVTVLHAARVSPVRQAALIWYQAAFGPRTYQGVLSWLANLKSRRFGAPQEAAAATWELRLRQSLGRLGPGR